MTKSRHIRKGLTLAESMLAVAILTIAASGVILPFASGTAVRQEGAQRTLAATLAADLMEEIIVTDYDSIITLYDGYAEVAGQVRGTDGTLLTGSVYSNLSRTVTCQNAAIAGVDLIWVIVRVYSHGNEIINLSTLVGR